MLSGFNLLDLLDDVFRHADGGGVNQLSVEGDSAFAFLSGFLHFDQNSAGSIDCRPVASLRIRGGRRSGIFGEAARAGVSARLRKKLRNARGKLNFSIYIGTRREPDLFAGLHHGIQLRRAITRTRIDEFFARDAA